MKISRSIWAVLFSLFVTSGVSLICFHGDVYWFRIALAAMIMFGLLIALLLLIPSLFRKFIGDADADDPQFPN